MSTTSKAKDMAHEAMDKGKEAAGNVMDKAKDIAAGAGKAVGNVASAIGQKAEDATAAVGSGMQSLGSTIRDKGPQSGVLGSATGTVASGLENAGRYLEDRNLSGMAEDFTDLIRRHPIPALLIGVGVGFLLARTLRA